MNGSRAERGTDARERGEPRADARPALHDARTNLSKRTHPNASTLVTPLRRICQSSSLSARLSFERGFERGGRRGVDPDRLARERVLELARAEWRKSASRPPPPAPPASSRASLAIQRSPTSGASSSSPMCCLT